MQPKVSVIIPVYKTEKYIEKCVTSLFDQTLDSIEYIFIDDCSPDHSIDLMLKVLEKYPNRKNQVKIIIHNVNLGVSKTRQDGVDIATGEYIIHCDPDDWIERDMYENLYQKAKSSDAEIVIANYIEEYENHSFKIRNLPCGSKREWFHKAVLNKFHMGLWNKLVKSSLAKIISFPTNVNLWEDMSIMLPMMLMATSIQYIDAYSYHYTINNQNSITHGDIRNNSLSQINATRFIEHFMRHNNLMEEIDWNDILLLKWNAKRGLLENPNKNNVNLWRDTFKENNCQFLSLKMPIKSKIITWLAINKYDGILKMLFTLRHYLIIN